MPALSPEEVDLALSTLVLRFGEGRVSSAVWKLGANTALAVGGGGPPWGEKQDDALLSALSSLAVLGGLPADTQHTDQWQSALSGLRVVREALATGGKAERQPGHACEPGYAPSTCCKKVRSGQGKHQRAWARQLVWEKAGRKRPHCQGGNALTPFPAQCLFVWLSSNVERWLKASQEVLRSVLDTEAAAWRLPGKRSPSGSSAAVSESPSPRLSRSSSGLFSEASASRLSRPSRPVPPPSPRTAPAKPTTPRPRAASSPASSLAAPFSGGCAECRWSADEAEALRSALLECEAALESERLRASAALGDAAEAQAALQLQMKRSEEALSQTAAALAARAAEEKRSASALEASRKASRRADELAQQLAAALSACKEAPAPAQATQGDPPVPVVGADVIANLRASTEAAWLRADALADELQTAAETLEVAQAQLAAMAGAPGEGCDAMAVPTPPAVPTPLAQSDGLRTPVVLAVTVANTAPSGVNPLHAAIGALLFGVLGASAGARRVRKHYEADQ